MKERHEKEVGGHGGKWRKMWQNDEIGERKRRKAERYAGHRVKQMEKSKEPKVSGKQWPLGFRPRQFARGGAVIRRLECRRVGKRCKSRNRVRQMEKSKASKINGEQWPLELRPKQFARG